MMSRRRLSRRMRYLIGCYGYNPGWPIEEWRAVVALARTLHREQREPR